MARELSDNYRAAVSGNKEIVDVKGETKPVRRKRC